MNLEQRIQELAASFSGTLGVAAKNLTTGETFSYQDTLSFHPASTIKLAVLAAVYEAIDAGTLTLDETLPLDPDLCRPDGGIMDGFTPGFAYPVRDLAHLMITISDNTATNLLIKRVGFEAVNGLLGRWGLRDTRLNRYIGIGPVPAGRETNRTTPADMARFLEFVALGAQAPGPAPGLTPASCQAMLATMQKQVFHHLTTRFIDEFDEELDAPTVRVASKSGWFRTVRNDCAVVFAPRATYVLAMFSKDCKDDSYKLENEAALLLPEVSQVIYEEWGR